MIVRGSTESPRDVLQDESTTFRSGEGERLTEERVSGPESDLGTESLKSLSY